MSKEKIVITGTSRGIGNHLAYRFLDEGYQVIGLSRSNSLIKYANYEELVVDLGKSDEVKDLTGSLQKESISGLINNAGIHGPIGAFEEISLDAWVETFNVNLFAAATLTQICLPSIRSNQGFIIFLSGGGSAFPRVNYSAYGVSKCAVVRLSEVLAQELAPDVRVYCIAPGPNRTSLLEEAVGSGEVVKEEDIVEFDDPERLCLFLAKNKNSEYSGKFIHVKDDYQRWSDREFDPDAYTLRRIDPRTLAKVRLGL